MVLSYYVYVCTTHGCFRWSRRVISHLKNASPPLKKFSNGARIQLYCQVSLSPVNVLRKTHCLQFVRPRTSAESSSTEKKFAASNCKRKLKFQFFLNHSKIKLTQHLHTYILITERE